MEFTIRIPKVTTVLRRGLLALPALLAMLAVTLVWPQADPITAAGTNSITSPDTGGDVGEWTSLALDGSGFPVVSYYDVTNYDLKVLHCNDADCAAGDESIYAPDTGGEVGKFSSLALDSNGNPVVSYYDSTNKNLKVLHCNDPNCTGGDESIASLDTGSWVGMDTSLALDSNGYPVVSYYDGTNSDLKVLHCDDVDCAGDESANITSPDPGGYVGSSSSLALDSGGNPVVSYFDAANGDLKVLHCNDADCAGDDESIESPDTGGIYQVGQSTSLALDSSGHPVVSYYDWSNEDLKVLHCNDPNCSGGDESIESLDTADDVGYYSSLALDASGYPLVSYRDATNQDLKVLHCNDVNCSGGDESITSPDTGGWVGWNTSLALDCPDFDPNARRCTALSGDPVVSYYDATNLDLKLLHCGDANCTVKVPTPGQINITKLGQYALPKTCFDVRDDLQTPLFEVCDNDFQGPPESEPVCIPDGVCQDEDAVQGLIRVTVSPGQYTVQESKAPFRHTADASKLDCDTKTGKCELTFVNTPDTKPWFPWDVNGDEIVDLFNDIVGVILHFGETKP